MVQNPIEWELKCWEELLKAWNNKANIPFNTFKNQFFNTYSGALIQCEEKGTEELKKYSNYVARAFALCQHYGDFTSYIVNFKKMRQSASELLKLEL